jgi:hypothetical protein
MKSKLIVNDPDRAIKITPEQAAAIGITDITANSQCADIETRGPWGVISQFKAISMAANFSDHLKMTKVAFFGPRKLLNPKPSSYQLEGRVFINGKKHSAFTSSQMFEINGHLIDVSVIFARMDI